MSNPIAPAAGTPLASFPPLADGSTLFKMGIADQDGNDAIGSTIVAPAATSILGRLKAAVDAIVAGFVALTAVGTETYQLAANTALAANAGTAPVTVARGGYFFFDAAFTGNAPALKLQRLGADGATYIDVVTRNAVGSGDPVGIPNGAQLRLFNASANGLTGLSAELG